MQQEYALSDAATMQREYALTDEGREDFDRDGFVGPFPAFLPDEQLDELRGFLEDMVAAREEQPLYGRFSVRDWHLIRPSILRLFTHPAIRDRLVDLAGEDLVLWRSKVFHKRPGEGPLGWHQEWGYFNGEEIGNDKPSLIPARHREDRWWNLTVWIPLDDITEENGPLQFVRGSQRTRYPIAMVPMVDSAFFHDPFIDVDDPRVIVERARECKLILDIDTSNLFDGVDPSAFTIEEMKSFVCRRLSELKAAVTLPFEADPADIITMRMKKGQFVIFTERTMHGSRENRTERSRLAINCRVTTTDTLVYPGRLRGDFIDGSNLDISRHRCILLSGVDRNGRNVY